MIIYDLRKPVDCENGISVGVVGENKTCTQQFLIKGLDGSAMNFAIHLRFADGSVNSIIPDSVTVLNSETTVVWDIKKNDIFAHGYFELQLEGRNNDELIFQTEIVTMYADESIPIEDKQYENPNSETLKLRDETQKILTEISQQEKQIEENVKIISESDLSKKADKADTLSGYGITDAYTKSQTDARLANKQNTLVLDSTPTIGSPNFVNSDRIGAALSYKANTKDMSSSLKTKADKADVDTALALKANKTDVDISLVLKEDLANKVSDQLHISSTTQSYPSVEYLNQYYYDFEQTDEMLAQKYDASNVESGTGTFTVVSDAVKPFIKSATFQYQKVGKSITLFGSIQFNEGVLPANGYIQFSGIPFRSIANSRIVSSTSKYSNAIVTIVTGTWVSLNFATTQPRQQDESMQFSVNYLIN